LFFENERENKLETMIDNTSITIREGDKLKGMTNYYVWALKMRAILRAENQWVVIETKQNHTVFPVNIDRDLLTKV